MHLSVSIKLIIQKKIFSKIFRNNISRHIAPLISLKSTALKYENPNKMKQSVKIIIVLQNPIMISNTVS